MQRLGPDHPDVLVTRSNLAACRGRAVDAAGAAAEFRGVLADMRRALERPNYNHTLHFAIAGNFASLWGEAGDAAGAAAALEVLIPPMVRAIGPDHPQTLISLSNLARWRGEAGDAAGAAAATEEVVADMERVLGLNHPDTLIARGNLARWRGEAEDAAGAANFGELRADIERVLGPDHPETLIARSSHIGAVRQGMQQVQPPNSESSWPTWSEYWGPTMSAPSPLATTSCIGGNVPA